MAQTPVKTPFYPDVPQAQGVPGVRRDPLAQVSRIQILLADVATVVQAFQPPQWGIFFSSGAPLVIPDTFESIDHRAEARISDYPIETGGFASYDKVILPHDSRVTLVCAGRNMDRTIFLANLETARKALDLFTIVTPDAVYTSVNITHYDYRRARQRGATMIYADVWFEEVRIVSGSQFTSNGQQSGNPQLSATQNPNSQSSVNQGSVQPQSPPAGLPIPPIPPLASESVPL